MKWHPTAGLVPEQFCPVKCEDGREGVARVLGHRGGPQFHGKVWATLPASPGHPVGEAVLLDGNPTFVAPPPEPPEAA